MSWAERIRQFALGNSEEDGGTLRSELAALYTELLIGAENLRQHAGNSPHLAGEQALHDLAQKDEALAEELRALLARLGGPLPLLQRRQPVNSAALNYWTRLCQDLEHHIETAQRLQRCVLDAIEEAPEFVDSVQRIAEREAEHIRELRNLIARADPQALN